MPEYIEKETAYKHFSERVRRYLGEAIKTSQRVSREYEKCVARLEEANSAKFFIFAMPAADVAPLVHGKWDLVKFNYMTNLMTKERAHSPIYKCNKCEFRTGKQAENYNYCPRCGAKMDLEEL